MSLVYVTGAPGTGKSTVYKELIGRGLEAYDMDDARFGGPVNIATGEPTTIPPIDSRPPEWFDRHEWRISRLAIEKLKSEAQNKTVYLCGTAATENLVWDLFDRIFYLDIDERTLMQRIASRENNDFGKTSEELDMILARYRDAQKKLKTLDVTIIDTTRPVAEVVEAIVAA